MLWIRENSFKTDHALDFPFPMPRNIAGPQHGGFTMKNILRTLVALMIGIIVVIGFAGKSISVETFDRASDMASIEKSLADPAIKTWVEKKYESVEMFKFAANLATDSTVHDIANSFQQAQQVGGDLATSMEAMNWVTVILVILAIASTIALFAMA